MRRDQANELSGCDDLGVLPEYRKVLFVARDQVIRARGIGTFQKYVVIGIACDVKAPRCGHKVTALLDELQQLLSETLANS